MRLSLRVVCGVGQLLTSMGSTAAHRAAAAATRAAQEGARDGGTQSVSGASTSRCASCLVALNNDLPHVSLNYGRQGV